MHPLDALAAVHLAEQRRVAEQRELAESRVRAATLQQVAAGPPGHMIARLMARLLARLRRPVLPVARTPGCASEGVPRSGSL